MRVPAITIVLLLVVSMIGATESAAQSAPDPLNVELTITGTPQLSRGKDNSSVLVQMNDRSVTWLAQNQHAFPAQPGATIAYQWAQRLAAGGSVSLQFGDVREELRTEPAGRKQLEEMIVCFLTPPERKGNEQEYLLECTAWDPARQARRDGKLIVEIVLVVVVTTGSPGDAFLGKPRPENALVYVRLGRV